jgi:hypothetical protein
MSRPAEQPTVHHARLRDDYALRLADELLDLYPEDLDHWRAYAALDMIAERRARREEQSS